MNKHKQRNSFRLSNGAIITTWGDFRKHIFPHVDQTGRRDLSNAMHRYWRLGKSPADLCKDLQNTVLAGCVNGATQS